LIESIPTLKTQKGIRRSKHIEEIIINMIKKNNKLSKNIIFMFHVVDENNPKRIIKIGDRWIGSCVMCKACVDMIESRYPWALKLKWRTLDSDGNFKSGIPENPILSFGAMRNEQYLKFQKTEKYIKLKKTKSDKFKKIKDK
jgi:hypothetical protein